MSGTMSTATTTLPVSQPYRRKAFKRTVQLFGGLYGMLKDSKREQLNNKGFLFSLMTKSNPQIGGGMNSGDIMLTGGSDEYITLLVGGVVINGARAHNGGAIREMNDGNYYGASRPEQDVFDMERFASEQNKNLCFSGRTYARGVFNVIPTYDAGANESTATFRPTKNGSYYLREMEGRKFLIHHPTTFAAHGGTTPFTLKRVVNATQAVFEGDMTGGTAIAQDDLLVPVGTADNKSSINKGINNLDYMSSITGEYYTANVANQQKLKSVQYDLTGFEVTRAVLEFMDGLFKLNYPAEKAGTKNHADITSPTQEAKMYFQAEGALRIQSTDGSVNYNPAIDYKGWRGRRHITDPFILPTDWFIWDLSEFYRYVQRDFGPWDYDNQEWRFIPGSGSIYDAIQKHWLGVEQVGHEDKRRNLKMANCATAGAATPLDI